MKTRLLSCGLLMMVSIFFAATAFAKDKNYTFYIGVKATESGKKIWTTGVIPFISIADTEKELSRLQKPNEKVIKENHINLVISYPLKKEFIFRLRSKKGFTRKQLVLAISKTYKSIYAKEELTSKQKVVPVNERKGLINRNKTNGYYGIYGHDIGDLDLASIKVKYIDGKVYIYLDVQS